MKKSWPNWSNFEQHVLEQNGANGTGNAAKILQNIAEWQRTQHSSSDSSQCLYHPQFLVNMIFIKKLSELGIIVGPLFGTWFAMQ